MNRSWSRVEYLKWLRIIRHRKRCVCSALFRLVAGLNTSVFSFVFVVSESSLTTTLPLGAAVSPHRGLKAPKLCAETPRSLLLAMLSPLRAFCVFFPPKQNKTKKKSDFLSREDEAHV